MSTKKKKKSGKGRKYTSDDYLIIFLLLTFDSLIGVLIMAAYQHRLNMVGTFFLVLLIIPLLYMNIQKLINNKISSTLVEVYAVLWVIVGIQAAAPIFQPKISASFGLENYYGWIENDTTYTGQYIQLDVYPPLFPMFVYDMNCQNIEFAYDVQAYLEKIVIPLTINSEGNKLKVCIDKADSWMWNKISVPVFIKSIQSVYDPLDKNITIFMHYINTEDNNKKYSSVEIL